MNFSTLVNLEHVIGGEKETIFFFNVNVEQTSVVYDYFNDNNFIILGPSESTESSDPTFSVILFLFLNFF